MAYNFEPPANNGKGIAVSNPAAITAAAPAALVTTDTAGGTYTAAEQTMLGHIKTDLGVLRTPVVALVTDVTAVRTAVVNLISSLHNANLIA